MGNEAKLVSRRIVRPSNETRQGQFAASKLATVEDTNALVNDFTGFLFFGLLRLAFAFIALQCSFGELNSDVHSSHAD
jgi:hypothetical protein